MSSRDDFGEWLRREREARGCTRQELADLSGISAQQISNIEVGRTAHPQDGTRKKLRDALASTPAARSNHQSAPSNATESASAADFELGGEVDRGAFGTVYEGRDRRLGRRVAIKIVRPSGEGVLSALGQAQILARANHPNVVTVHSVTRIVDPETSESRDAIVMEYLEGEKLSKRLLGPRFDPAEARTIGLGLIEGLRHLHNNSLVHQDLHGENVLLCGGAPKIIDPMHLTTFAQLSEAVRQTRVRRDLASLHAMLLDLLAHSSLASGVQGPFSALPPATISIDEIRKGFESATTEPGRSDTASDHGKRQEVHRRALSRSVVGATVVALLLISVVGVVIHRQSSQVPGNSIDSGKPTLASAIAHSSASAAALPASFPIADTSVISSSVMSSPSPRSGAQCSLPKFALGAARRYVATSDSEAGARLIKAQLRVLLGQQPKSGAWSTAVHHYATRVGGKTKWVVVFQSMSPGSASAFCEWLLRCQGWPEICVDRLQQ